MKTSTNFRDLAPTYIQMLTYQQLYF